jgi:hypothetical protein
MLYYMESTDQPAILRAALRSWGRRRRALEAERDSLVQAALQADISIEEVHQSTGLARTTVDRIGKEEVERQ